MGISPLRLVKRGEPGQNGPFHARHASPTDLVKRVEAPTAASSPPPPPNGGGAEEAVDQASVEKGIKAI
jgi:hypothetical protein